MNILRISCIFIVALAPLFCGDRSAEPFVYAFGETDQEDPSAQTEQIAQNLEKKSDPTEFFKPTNPPQNSAPEYEIEPEAAPSSYKYGLCPTFNVSLYYQNANIKNIESEYLTLEKSIIFSNRQADTLFMMNSGASLCENEFFGAFFGAGFRKFCNSVGFGTNIYCDYLHRSQNLFRVSWGGEIFSNKINVYWNIYIPVGKHIFAKSDHAYDEYVGDYFVTCHEERSLAKEFDINFSKKFCCGKQSTLELFFGAAGLDFYSRKKILYFQSGAKLEFRNFFSVEPKIFITHKAKVYLGIDVELDLFQVLKGSCCGKPIFEVNRNNMMRSYHCCDYKTNY